MSRHNGRRFFLLVTCLGLIVLLILSIAKWRTLWQSWRIHRLECVLWTGNYAVGAHRGTLLWRAKDERPYSESVRWEDRVVARMDDGALECRSILDGELIWKLPGPSKSRGEPTKNARSSVGYSISLARNILLQADKQGLRALEIKSGELLWSIAFAPKQSSYCRMIPGSHGFLLLGGKALEYYDLATGERRWRKDGNENGAGFLDEKSVVSAIDGDIVRLSVETGTELWRVSATKTGFYVRLFIAGPYVIAGSQGRTAWTSCLDGATGNILWSSATQASVAAALAPDHEHLLLALGEGFHKVEIAALCTSTWTQAWSHALTMEGVEILFERETVFMGSYDPISCGAALECLDVAQGHLIWTAPVRGIYVDHSKYSNAIRLTRREDWISVVGFASGGDYVETFDARTGTAISRWKSEEGW